MKIPEKKSNHSYQKVTNVGVVWLSRLFRFSNDSTIGIFRNHFMCVCVYSELYKKISKNPLEFLEESSFY